MIISTQFQYFSKSYQTKANTSKNHKTSP